MSEAFIILQESDLIPEPVPRRRLDAEMLCLCSLTVVLAFLLQVVDGEYIAFRAFPTWTLPHSCMSRSMFHFDCPGCGLTRSFILLAEGRFAASFARHHVGIPLALATLLQLPYRTQRLLQPGRDWFPKPWRRAFSWMLILMLLGNWVVKQLVPGW
jgi:hypothetical protein